MQSAIAWGFDGSTIQPVEPIICFASPTSVLIDGTDEAIDSKSVKGKHSLLEDNIFKS